MMNVFETEFNAWYLYSTAEPYQFKKKTLGRFENLVFVIMSTRENIHLITRAPILYGHVSYVVSAH